MFKAESLDTLRERERERELYFNKIKYDVFSLNINTINSNKPINI